MTGVFEVSGVTSIAFWVVSILAIGAAVMVVMVRNVFHAALFLAASFTGVAGLYFLLSAEFIGVVQILVYVGAVSVLIVFAIMLVRDVGAASRPVSRKVQVSAALVAGLVAAAVLFVSFDTEWTSIKSVDDPGAAAALAGTYIEVDLGGSAGPVVQAVPSQTEGARPGVLADSTGVIGTLLIREYLLAFEVIGVVLTAALIGALALMRDRRAA